MALTKSTYGQQKAKAQTLSDSDYLVFTQLNGNAYNSGSSQLGLVKSLIFNQLLNDEQNRIANFKNDRFLKGTGSAAHPIYLDTNAMNALWVPNTAVGNITYVGDFYTSYLPFTLQSTTLSLTQTLTIYTGGVKYSIPANTFDLSGYGQGTTVQLYLYINNGAAIQFQTTFQTETAQLIWLGEFTVGNTSFNTGGTPFFRMGTVRLSSEPKGSSIGVSEEHPSNQGYLPWGGTGSDTVPLYGVDTTQTQGAVTFNKDVSNFKVVNSGKFFIKNLTQMLATMPDAFIMRRHGNVAGGTGYLNSQQIWSDIGDNVDTIDIRSYLVEGWNTVTFTDGGCTIRLPFIN